jgi:hypothetical protein
MSELLEPGQSRFITTTPNFVAVPTYGCFVAGYLLITPPAHVLSFGGLGAGALAEAQGLVDSLADRLRAVYRMPVLGSSTASTPPGPAGSSTPTGTCCPPRPTWAGGWPIGWPGSRSPR